jgi:hypothetical protein
MSSRIPLIEAMLLLEARPSGAMSLFGACLLEALLVDCSLPAEDRINVEVPPDRGCATRVATYQGTRSLFKA